MAEISLRSYLRDIERIVEEGRTEEALVHCRRILEQYPQHLDTYRLLGATLLKCGEYEDAEDIFLRVLSADPEDLGAHVGLADINANTDRTRSALRHLELAYDLSPYDEGVRQKLSGLVEGQQNGPGLRLMLTPAALARIHVRGGLFPQAIHFLRAATFADGSRLDLQLLLAEALWRDGQRVEAVEVCRKLLGRLPFCVRANAILADSFLAMERKEEARICLQKMQSVLLLERDDDLADDPAGVLLDATEVISLPERITVYALDIRERQPAAGETGSSWMSRLNLSDAVPAGKSEDLLPEAPAWLSAFSDLESAPVVQGAPEASPPAQDQPTAIAGGGTPTDEEATKAGLEESRAADIVAGVAAIALAARRRERGESEPETEESTMSETDEQEGLRPDAEDAPDELKATLAWLEELAAKQGVPLQDLPSIYESETSQVDDAYPDWLTGDMADVPTGAETLAASTQDEQEAPSSEAIPAWLRERDRKSVV